MTVGKVTSLLSHFREGYMRAEGLDANFHHTSLEGSLFNFHAGGVYIVEPGSSDEVKKRLKQLPEIENGYYVFVSEYTEVVCNVSKNGECLCFDTFQTVDVENNSSEEVLNLGTEVGKSIESLVVYLTSDH